MTQFNEPDSAASGVFTGEVYFKRITALEPIRRIRSSFQSLVLALSRPGDRLFDFGAGPGIDALFFAQRGFSVDAYDIDPEMRRFFKQHCKVYLDSGHIHLEGGGFRDFLARAGAESGHSIDLIISNFAPLNQVEDLPELFSKFHSLTGPKGRVLVSVLNPVFLGDMRSCVWWRNLPRLWRYGESMIAGGNAPRHTRWRLDRFNALSAPYFVLSRAYQQISPHNQMAPGGVDLRRGVGSAWLHMLRSRFVTLLFEKIA
jgi:SAM-dependent methyltransferase